MLVGGRIEPVAVSARWWETVSSAPVMRSSIVHGAIFVTIYPVPISGVTGFLSVLREKCEGDLVHMRRGVQYVRSISPVEYIVSSNLAMLLICSVGAVPMCPLTFQIMVFVPILKKSLSVDRVTKPNQFDSQLAYNVTYW